jgi:hypothetical protein
MARTAPTTVTTTLALLWLALGSAAGRADVLLLDGLDVAAQSAALRPKAGMSMTAVESTYGAPTQRHSAVGEPPITRWDYADFSVYFEHAVVVHAVARH